MTFSKEIIHKKLIFSKEIIFSGQGTGHFTILFFPVVVTTTPGFMPLATLVPLWF